MNRIIERIMAEPVRVFGIIQAAVLVGASFGLDLSAEQQAAILALAAAVLGIGEGVRSRVTPNQRVRARRVQ